MAKLLIAGLLLALVAVDITSAQQTCKTLKESYKGHECCGASDKSKPVHPTMLCSTYEESEPLDAWPLPDENDGVEQWWLDTWGYNPAKMLNEIYDTLPSVGVCGAYRYLLHKMAEMGYLPLKYDDDAKRIAGSIEDGSVTNFSSGYTYADWFKGYCAKLYEGDASVLPANFTGHLKAYQGWCKWYTIIMINSKVEEHSALFPGGTLWYTSLMTSADAKNLPSEMQSAGGLLATQQNALLDYSTGPWAKDPELKDGKVIKAKMEFNPSWSFPADPLRWNQFHFWNALSNLPYTGFAQKFQTAFDADWAYEATGLTKDDYGGVNYFPLIQGMYAQPIVIHKGITEFVPKNLASSDLTMLPYMIARRIFYKKAPAACTAGFQAGYAALDKMYGLLAEEKCPSESEAIDLTWSLRNHVSTSQKAASIPIHGDAQLIGRWSVPIYSPQTVDTMAATMHAISCDINKKLHAFGCNIWVNESTCEAVVDVVAENRDTVCSGC